MTRKPRRRVRKILLALGTLVVVLAVVIVFLPAIASATLARGIVKDLVEKQVNATATVGNVMLRWSGPQSIEGLVLRDDAGRDIANIDVHLKTSFLKLAMSNMDSYTVTVSGTVHGTLHEDRSTSFSELLGNATDPTTGGNTKNDDPSNSTPNLTGFVPVHVTILDLDLQLNDEIRREDTTVAITTGEVIAALGEPITISANGTVTRGQTTGNFTIGSSIANLMQADGSLTTRGAAVELKANASDIPVPGVVHVDQLDRLSVVAITDNLAQYIDVTSSAEIALTEEVLDSDASQTQSSTLTVDVSLFAPLNDRLKPTITPQSVTGIVQAEQLPADLLELVLASVLADLPFDLSRDIGPSIDVLAEAEPGQRRKIRLELNAANATVSVAGKIETEPSIDDIASGTIDITTLTANFMVHPELVADATDSKLTIDHSITLNINAGALYLPAAKNNNKRSFETAAGNITMIVDEAFTVTRADDDRPVNVAGIQLTAASKSLGDELTVFGQGIVNNSNVLIDQRIRNLLAGDGSLNRNWQQYQPTGSVRVQHLPGKTVAHYIDKAPQPVLDLLAGSVDVVLTTAAEGDTLNATLDIQAHRFSANAQAVRTADAVRIESADLSLTIEPELVTSMQGEQTEPIVLERALPVSIDLVSALTLPADPDGHYDWPTEPLMVSINTDDAIRLLNVPTVAEPFELRDTSINLIASIIDDSISNVNIAAAAQWHTQSTDRTVGDLMFEAIIARNVAHGNSISNVHIALERLAIRRMERALGQEVNSLAKWIGSRGNLYLDVQPNPATNAATGTFNAEFTQLAGTFDFELSESELLTLTGQASELTITAAALNDWLRTEPERDNATPAATVRNDVNGSFELNTLRLPLAMLRDEGFNPADVVADVQIGIDNVVLIDPEDVATTISDLSVGVSVDSIAEPLGFELSGSVRSKEDKDAESGRIHGSGHVSNLLTADNRIDTSGATLDMTLDGTALPIGLADAFGRYDGLLVAALGETAEADLRAESFSPNAGSLHGTLTTTHGTMNLRLLGRAGVLRIREEVPLQAELELTPEFRDRVLQPIHPLFADIRSIEQPIRATVTAAKIPIDGDVAQLDADITMTVGAVEFSNGSALLAVLDLFRESTETIPGRIEPITARIRNGVVTYDRFATVIGKYTLNFNGQIDLNSRQVDLRFELPGEAVAQTFHELRGYVESLVIPFRTRGVIGNLKTEIDPDYNIVEEAAKAGFKGALDKELGDELGGLLDDLFKNTKKKPDPKKSDGNTSDDD